MSEDNSNCAGCSVVLNLHQAEKELSELKEKVSNFKSWHMQNFYTSSFIKDLITEKLKQFIGEIND